MDGTHKRGRYGAGRGAGWAKARRLVMARDRWLCQPCARSGRLSEAHECDHVIPLCNGGSDDLVNLQAICRPCHRVKSAREANGGNDVKVKGCDASGKPYGRDDW